MGKVPGETNSEQQLSELIADAFTGKGGRQTVGGLLDEAGRKGRGLLLVVVSLPVAVPVTPPGLPTIFALLVLGLTLQIALKKEKLWLPKWLGNREIKAKPDSKFVRFMVRLVKFFERFTKVRHSHFLRFPLFYTFVVPCIFIGAIGMLNLIPGLSVLPALGVFLIGMGMIEEDGSFAMTGAIIAIIGTLISVAPFVAPLFLSDSQVQALEGLREQVKVWLESLNPWVTH